MIKFNVPPFIGDEIINIQKAIDSQKNLWRWSLYKKL